MGQNKGNKRRIRENKGKIIGNRFGHFRSTSSKAEEKNKMNKRRKENEK